MTPIQLVFTILLFAVLILLIVALSVYLWTTFSNYINKQRKALNKPEDPPHDMP